MITLLRDRDYLLSYLVEMLAITVNKINEMMKIHFRASIIKKKDKINFDPWKKIKENRTKIKEVEINRRKEKNKMI